MNSLDSREELLEALYDLKHDLGKYIKLPVTMLPRNADYDDLIYQTKKAVFETRRGPNGLLSATDIFEAFVKEWDEEARAFMGYPRLGEVVKRAVAWGERVADRGVHWKREDLERDLSMVGEAIQALILEVAGGESTH